MQRPPRDPCKARQGCLVSDSLIRRRKGQCLAVESGGKAAPYKTNNLLINSLKSRVYMDCLYDLHLATMSLLFPNVHIYVHITFVRISLLHDLCRHSTHEHFLR